MSQLRLLVVLGLLAYQERRVSLIGASVCLAHVVSLHCADVLWCLSIVTHIANMFTQSLMLPGVMLKKLFCLIEPPKVCHPDWGWGSESLSVKL